MIDRTWISRRFVAVILLIPGYTVGWLWAEIFPVLTPFLPWGAINPYTIGAVGSTIFNTIMWDYWVKLVYRFGGKPVNISKGT